METKRKFSQSVGAGLQSVFGSSGRTYFVIEHKSQSDRHAPGDRKEIIVDQITLGRDSSCQIRFGNTFPTVSRKHAMIVKQGENWMIRHMGNNPTLVNGRPVAKEWYLQNGDEIQLSYEGPKMGFIIPGNPMVKSINLSRRLSLFREQALRPYKQAMIAVAAVFLLAIMALGYFLYEQQQENKRLQAEHIALAEETRKLAERAIEFSGNVDSLQRIIASSDAARRRMEAELRTVRNRITEFEQQGSPGHAPPPSMDPLFPGVYYIVLNKLILQFEGETEEITEKLWSGTGFLLNDKRFLTARHVIEPWFFAGNDELQLAINLIASNGGTVIAHYTAFSPDGSRLSFTNNDFRRQTSTDEILSSTDDQGNPVMLRIASGKSSDWASFVTDKTGVINAGNELSRTLVQRTDLHILGYPMRLGASDLSSISPIYGSATVAASGLDSNNVITVGNRNFTSGNSGGPAFALINNEYIAVGIVSAMADNLGFIVPISETR